MTLIAKGKVKEVHEYDESTLRFVFTDQISVFDKVIPSLIPRKGESLCRTSAHWLMVAKELGINTHFIDIPAPNEMLVRRIRRVENLNIPEEERKACIIPLEFICRHYLAGSMWDRVRKGKVDKCVLGIESEPEHGQKIPKPFIELTTKFEEYDRPISEDEAITSFGIRENELAEIKSIILELDSRIGRDVGRHGLIHVDGKKEFGIDENGKIMLIDTFGTADEDRFWEKDEYERGRLVDMSKEFVRGYYRESGYHESLEKARESGAPEPDIPPLPDDWIAKTGELYARLYERITGQEF